MSCWYLIISLRKVMKNGINGKGGGRRHESLKLSWCLCGKWHWFYMIFFSKICTNRPWKKSGNKKNAALFSLFNHWALFIILFNPLFSVIYIYIVHCHCNHCICIYTFLIQNSNSKEPAANRSPDNRVSLTERIMWAFVTLRVSCLFYLICSYLYLYLLEIFFHEINEWWKWSSEVLMSAFRAILTSDASFYCLSTFMPSWKIFYRD